MNNKADRVIFVIPTKTKNSIDIGRRNLKLAFQNDTHPYFDCRLNWLEICSLVTVPTVRWHQRKETITPDVRGNRFSVGAPPAVLLVLNLNMRPNALETDYSDYGGTKAVTGLDQRVAWLTKARGHPIIRIGTWRNGSDLAFAIGMGVYDTFNAEAPDRIMVRILCSNHDYIHSNYIHSTRLPQ